jgi:tRNA N6-adenosine threonylcarbamoyltransferase
MDNGRQTLSEGSLVLGLETSCDETAAAVVLRTSRGEGRILSNVVRTQWERHRPYGGVVPEIAARAHVECLDVLTREAMREACVGFDDLDAVAATAGPGLIGGLIVGLITAKVIALSRKLPFLAVHHLEAHALTVGLTEGLKPPYLLLLVSGGHTQLLIVRSVGDYERLGTTIDDALGEAFDKTAKLLGLGFPGGPAVEQAARSGDAARFDLPRPMVGREVLHFSFAGLKTAVRRTAERLAPLKAQDVADLAAAFEEAVTASVTDRCARAMDVAAARLDPAVPRRFVIAGGVASNARLRTVLHDLAASCDFSFHVPPVHLCSDNAAMIAWAGAERLALGLTDPLNAPVHPRWPLDRDAQPAIGAGVKA